MQAVSSYGDQANSNRIEKLPKRVWGEPRNVTDTLPPCIEAPVTRPPSPKRAGLRRVWLVLAILVRLLGYVMRASTFLKEDSRGIAGCLLLHSLQDSEHSV